MELHKLNFPLNQVYKVENLPADENKKIIYVFRETSDKDKDTWNIHRILYIGISTNAENRLTKSHEKIDPALQMLKDNNFLTISYHVFNGNTSEDTIRAIENALINQNQPPLNDQNKKEYHFEKYGNIDITCEGPRATLLKKNISLRQ